MSSSVGDGRVLITGGSGQLGTAFRRLVPDAHFPTRSALDLSDTDQVATIVRESGPSLVINCGAYTAVDAAEDDVETADAVNARAVGVLAEECARVGARFVTYSTDYVFDGTAGRPYVESDPTKPINAYGASKQRGEQIALAANPETFVIRTSWLLSATHDNFVTAILRRAATGSVSVVADQHGCPTVCDDLAAATLQAIDAGSTGVMHITNRGETTWYELARTAVSAAGLDEDVVEPCTSEEFPTRARRPAYSVLGTERVDTPELAPWQDAVVTVAAGQWRRISSPG